MALIKAVRYSGAMVWDGTNTQEVLDLITVPKTLISDDGQTLVILVTTDLGVAPVDFIATNGQYLVFDSGMFVAFSPADFVKTYCQLP